MDHRETLQVLSNAIAGQSPMLEEILRGRDVEPTWAQWYDLVLSDLTLLVDDAEVKFVDTAVTGDDLGSKYAVRVTIFTEHLVILVTADFDSDVERHKTRARSRADLKALEVAAGTGTLGDDWPGKVRVKLDYGEDDVLTLPGQAKHAQPVQHAKVAALLPSLKKDLKA